MIKKTVIDMVKLDKLRALGYGVEAIAKTLGVDEETVRTIVGGFDRIDSWSFVRNSIPLRKCA